MIRELKPDGEAPAPIELDEEALDSLAKVWKMLEEEDPRYVRPPAPPRLPDDRSE